MDIYIQMSVHGRIKAKINSILAACSVITNYITLSEYSSQISTDWLNMSCCNECCSVFICSPSLLLAGTQSQLNLERSKSRMGTFVEGGPMAETNPEEGYETSVITSDACLK